MSMIPASFSQTRWSFTRYPARANLKSRKETKVIKLVVKGQKRRTPDQGGDDPQVLVPVAPGALDAVQGVQEGAEAQKSPEKWETW